MLVKFLKRTFIKRGVLSDSSFKFKQTTKIGFKPEGDAFILHFRISQYPISVKDTIDLTPNEVIVRTTKTHVYTSLIFAMKLDTYFETALWVQETLDGIQKEIEEMEDIMERESEWKEEKEGDDIQ